MNKIDWKLWGYSFLQERMKKINFGEVVDKCSEIKPQKWTVMLLFIIVVNNMMVYILFFVQRMH